MFEGHKSVRPPYVSFILFRANSHFKGTNFHPYGHMVKNLQTESMVEIYSKGLVRADRVDS